MSITSKPCVVHEIHFRGEDATIVIHEKEEHRSRSDPLTTKLVTGEILVRSTLGNYCGRWKELDTNFAVFLKGITFDAFMAVCAGNSNWVYHHENSVRNILDSARAIHLDGRCTSTEYRRFETEFSSAANDHSPTPHGLNLAAQSLCQKTHHPFKLLLAENWAHHSTAPSGTSLRFWSQIWPNVILALEKTERSTAEPKA